MYSKGIKWTTFIINTVLYAMVVFIFYFSDEVHDLKYYDQLSDTLPSKIDAIEIWLIFLCVPATLLFSFIMRSIDWHIDEGDGGYVWIFGIILSMISLWLLTGVIMKKPSESQITLFGIMLAVSYLFCTLATFVHQGMMESSGSSGGSSGGSSSDGYSRWTDTDGHSWSCYGGGCM